MPTLLGVNLWAVACFLPLVLGPCTALADGTLAGWAAAFALAGIGGMAPLGLLWFARGLASGPLLFATVTLWPELLAQAGWLTPAPFLWVAALWLGYLWAAYAERAQITAPAATVRVSAAVGAPDSATPILNGMALFLMAAPLVLVECALARWRAAGGLDAAPGTTGGAVLGLLLVGVLWLGWLRWGVVSLLRARLQRRAGSPLRVALAAAASALAFGVWMVLG